MEVGKQTAPYISYSQIEIVNIRLKTLPAKQVISQTVELMNLVS